MSDDMRALGEAAGLNVFDTALPQQWVDHVLELTTALGKREYPYGFVWGYDFSPIWGEPIPLTDDAKALAKVIGIKPR